MDLLYLTAYWHSLAKLHLHTESSVCVREEVHKGLRNGLCNITDVTCKAFRMVEMDKEYAERKRGKAQRAACTSFGAQGKTASVSINLNLPMLGSASTGKKPCEFSLATYKLHATGHYPYYIRNVGTTDSYSTQIVRLLIFLSEFVAYSSSTGRT